MPRISHGVEGQRYLTWHMGCPTKKEAGEKRVRRMKITHCCPGRDQITFVEYEDNLLVALLFLQEIDDRVAASAKGISGIQNVHDNVGRIDDFVQLAENSSRSSLQPDGLDDIGMSRKVGDSLFSVHISSDTGREVRH